MVGEREMKVLTCQSLSHPTYDTVCLGGLMTMTLTNEGDVVE